MLLSVTDQIIILLASVYGGLLLGLIFDLYRFVRDILRFGRAITIIGDIIFWALGLILILSVVYNSSSGMVRVYQLLGFAMGMVVYFKLLSRAARGLLYALVYCVRGFVYSIIKLISGPVRLLSNMLWKPCNRVKIKTAKLFSRLGRDLRKYIPMLKNKK
ncbi:MAG: spore cortex biosynthesis protein YabQ [Bacillota bacterium]|nr:spore cortex biosynthesis protein YabQ [Bacillota bacterium]MDD3298094.1 spore cortex biosynthesis protein YabQ [Bacillota bacterium]MDD3850281.1 spore cortex biosynthesis protein YabQ [Bacillota bacterium]MDD4707625.1 spore cortex biosynthesis protein YabQ [Bacillota bacterium]